MDSLHECVIACLLQENVGKNVQKCKGNQSLQFIHADR